MSDFYDYDYSAAMDQVAEWEEEEREREWVEREWEENIRLMEENILDVMNQETVEKCLLICSTPIISELHDIIKSFAFQDTQIPEFQHRKKLTNVLDDIKLANSRKNGFNGFEEKDTNDEYWSFRTTKGDVKLQAISCQVCGNYRMSNTFYIYPVINISHDRAVCLCHPIIQDIVDEDEQDNDW